MTYLYLCRLRILCLVSSIKKRIQCLVLRSPSQPQHFVLLYLCPIASWQWHQPLQLQLSLISFPLSFIVFFFFLNRSRLIRTVQSITILVNRPICYCLYLMKEEATKGVDSSVRKSFFFFLVKKKTRAFLTIQY